MRIRVCSVDELPAGSATKIDAWGVNVAVFNDDGTYFALADTCSHEMASLSEGDVEEGCVECPKHGARFDLATGLPKTLPATSPVATYTVVEDDGVLYVEE
jgi:3-phenylpropionate/trans-cinnamate dioxygenase ferredoxin component